MPSHASTTDSKYAPTAWGSQGGRHELELPSGQVILCKRPGPQGLMEAGLLEALDTLTAIVDGELIPKAEGQAPEIKLDPAKLMADPAKLEQMLHMMNRIVCHVVIEPQVKMTPNDITNREHGVVYTDQIDMDDKSFILQFAMGGTRDLETFRQESQAALGSMAAVPEAPDAA
jgi:hypothetical protein